MRVSRTVSYVSSGLTLLSLILGAVSLCNANIIYDVDLTIGTGDAIGDIVTDGTLGSITAANIVNWDITVSDSFNTVELSGPTDFGYCIGTGLSATSSELLFDFSPPDGNCASFEGGNGSGASFLCFGNGYINCSFDWAQGVYVEGLQIDGNETGLSTPLVGLQAIATNGQQVGSTPEPSTMVYLAEGVVAILGFLKVRNRHRAG